MKSCTMHISELNTHNLYKHIRAVRHNAKMHFHPEQYVGNAAFSFIAIAPLNMWCLTITTYAFVFVAVQSAY